MKTQEELKEKLRKDLLEQYKGDKGSIAEIETLIAEEKYNKLFENYWPDTVRLCSECGKLMDEGYCIGDGEEYYCSDKCLHKNYSSKEYKQMYEEGNAYYTEW